LADHELIAEDERGHFAGAPSLETDPQGGSSPDSARSPEASPGSPEDTDR
jgi:hypothetical protein